MLAQTISNTNPTAPNNIHNFGRTSLTSSSLSGRNVSGGSRFASSIAGMGRCIRLSEHSQLCVRLLDIHTRFEPAEKTQVGLIAA